MRQHPLRVIQLNPAKPHKLPPLPAEPLRNGLGRRQRAITKEDPYKILIMA